ncbi:type IV secretion system DNA-binding domain-containing protein [Acidicapsa ligni]|uniref:type IV secretion system DNA-binding domain-containing protein n=1 Tax=Acidicapsa ligni TaxID=542300 RepID=UPI0021DF7E87|nr:type IV secretion system DNA-binding domain-containing protein [Acidicapsa ligni]
MVGKGQQRLVIGDEIEQVPSLDKRPGYRLTDEGVKNGIARLTRVTASFNDRGLHRVMSEAVYADHEAWEFYQKPVYLSLAFFVLALFVAVPKDRARRMLYKHGRRLRGPELVTTAELNAKLGKSKGLRTQLPDGVMFINEERTWADKLLRKNLSRWARVPRDREAMHFLIVGDSGTGKSAAIRQMLAQIWERNEAGQPEHVAESRCRPSGLALGPENGPMSWLLRSRGNTPNVRTGGRASRGPSNRGNTPMK